MATALRSNVILVLLLVLLGTAVAQGQTGAGAPEPPVVTATASSDRVRYVSMGEVNQTRLQVFAPDGTPAFDSGFRLGNTIDWQLVDQQGARLTDGSYIFLVTVKDFSQVVTQKYGRAVVEKGEVYLDRPSRGGLPQAQAAALESNKQAEDLSSIDRIGAAGLNRTATATTAAAPASSVNTTQSPVSRSQAEAGTENIAGVGTSTRIVKWIDGAEGILGDSTITETGGKVGIGTATPDATLKVFSTTTNTTPAFWVSDQNNYLGAAMYFEWRGGPVNNKVHAMVADNYGFSFYRMNDTGTNTIPGGFTTPDLVISPAGRVGIGMNSPQAKLDVAGSVKITGIGNGLVFPDGSVLTSAVSGTGSPSGTSVIAAINDPATGGIINDNRLPPLIRFVPGAEQLSVGDAQGTAPMINLRGGSTCCSGPGGHTPAWFKVFQNGSFVATGNLGIGSNPMPGKGYRTSWDAYRGAFRSGYADTEWADDAVGFFSWAGGSNSTASGLYSLAFGDTNFARSTSSIAFGSGNEVKGAAGFSAGAYNRVCDTFGVALGSYARSGGPYIDGKCDPDTFNIRGLAAVAMGFNVTADQDHTMAFGKFATNNGFSGTFIWSDGSATASADTFRNTANNEFAARATGGFRFRTNLGSTTGCNLPAGSGVFNCTSSRNTKENFMTVRGEDVLAKLRFIPVTSWNYISEGRGVRHIGPVAEDFFQAFNLGTGNTSIGVQDLAGVSLAAVKALDERTEELRQKTFELQQKSAEVEQLRNKVSVMEDRLTKLEQSMQTGRRSRRAQRR